MKKFVGELFAGDKVLVRMTASHKQKDECEILEIEFHDEGDEFEHAVMRLSNGDNIVSQTWYTTEEIEVVE